MRKISILILLTLLSIKLTAQKEFHVFPDNDEKTPGTTIGDGSLKNPWNLQTALYQKNTVVNGGDIIWLHGGIYSGKFISTLNSSIINKHIIVSSISNEWAVLNGNVSSKNNSVLIVKGSNVIYKDFEVTWLGEFSRYEGNKDFFRGDGINHNSGMNCKFINLNIHNNPGLGFGSWKETGGTIIENCFIYNNGFISKNQKGRGEGMYVQNSSELERIIQNNVIFNNYYKGIEVWSANKYSKEEYVKNITLRNNVIFNSGMPSGLIKDNLIIASDDRNGINIAKNINVLDNIFYHNSDILNNQINGDAASLTLGFHPNAPVENINLKNNIIIGRNNALRIFYAKSLSFKNNIIYCGYVHFNKLVLNYINSGEWEFRNNNYFTKNSTPFRISKHKDFTLNNWRDAFNLDLDSKTNNLKYFELNSNLNISKNQNKPNSYRVVLFSKEGNDVLVDFSKHDISKNSNYKIYDVENKKTTLKSGRFGNKGKILVPMNSLAFEKPSHNTKAQKTLNNFGVYIIEFNKNPVKRKKSLLSRLFGKLF